MCIHVQLKNLYSTYTAHQYFLYINISFSSIPLELDTGMYCIGCIAERERGGERERENKSVKGRVWLKKLSSKRHRPSDEPRSVIILN